MQIEHYQQLYDAQTEVKSIQHNIRNKMLAISGLLAGGCAQSAKERVDEIYSSVVDASRVVNTGLPPVDAVLASKTFEAKKSGIIIEHRVVLGDGITVEQFDLAVIVATALDNAIEGVLRSTTDVGRCILLNIGRTDEIISIVVTNSSSGPMEHDFRTTKSDKRNHGFGLVQLRSIAQKYDGNVNPSYDRKTEQFMLKILLKNRDY